MDGITNSMDMSLSKLQELMMGREAYPSSAPSAPLLGWKHTLLSHRPLGTKGLHLEAGSHVRSCREVVLEPEQVRERQSWG